MPKNHNGPKKTLKIAACDLGKSSAKLLVASFDSEGKIKDLNSEIVPHDGEALRVFSQWYRRKKIADCAALGATGLHSDELRAPVMAALPEDACLERALSMGIGMLAGPLNLVSIGARGYAVLSRDAAGHIQYLENNKCSSGTGETMVKIAGRFGLSIEEADQLARAAKRAIQITARCSVFTKSEMTHFGNQGRPADELFKGYFASVASYVAALLARAQVDGPVYLIGGGAKIGALADALGKILGQAPILSEHAQMLEAIGAAGLSADQFGSARLEKLPADPESLILNKKRRFRVLAPARDFSKQVRRLEAAPLSEAAKKGPAILGLDLGSTGAKAVLTAIESGQLLHDAFDRTRGNPVEAALGLIGNILKDLNPDVRAIGLTGSGREAAATVIRAAYPQFGDRILVINEIVAHATAAIRCDDQTVAA